MIQIIGLRSFEADGKIITYDKLFEVPVKIKSVKHLFKNLDLILNFIPEKERWNLFYTLADSTSEKKMKRNGKEGLTHRVFIETKTIAFDIDGINQKYLESYKTVICSAIDVDHTKVGFVSSGNGCHVLISLEHSITNKDYFKKHRPHYKTLCQKINCALQEAGLSGEADPAVFEHRRILRLPGTVNRKPDKPERRCELISPIIADVNFSIIAASGVPAVKEDEQIDPKALRKMTTCDSQAIMEGCLFLKHCRDNPNEISEPQWYAALSITARMNDGKSGSEWSHELSKGYSAYDPEETDLKIEQALETSGPRKCSSINDVWGGCSTCPHFQKVSSPLLIQGKNTIPTASTGFHFIDFEKPNAKPRPDYEGLRKHFENKHYYKGLDDSGSVHIWDKTHYKPMGTTFIDAFCQDNFNPPAKNNMRSEFRGLVKCTNVKPIQWWQDTPKRKINFQNGYLDIDSMDFRPHDKEIGFRYVLPYEYDPQADAPIFTNMLQTVTGYHEDAQKVLLEFMGYALSNDDCWTQKALILTGEGANGKSTFIEVLQKLAGSDNYSSLNLENIAASEYSKQLLDGKLFNVSEETPTRALLDSSLFKCLVTGGEIQVRQPFQAPYFIKNRAKLISTCNELPAAIDNSYGFYRRLIIVPFEQKFTKNTPGFDPHIATKLEDELSGIFNMAIEGYHRLVKQQSFTDCQKITDTIKDYEIENNTVLYWAKENLVTYTNGGFDDHFTPIRDLYDNYRRETEAQGRRAVTFLKFSKELPRLDTSDVWQGIGYEQRYDRRYVDRGDDTIRVRGLKGVGYRTFS